ncbi:hypothetical protein [Pseudomonas synxantha]|uniref:Uncharacterized protein n=1 Tax=Pseudomonas synxantha TaxID=47883 RepID=A0ACC6JS62_9PSED|nr:hypothetical protein [Pseudomonas synxantha]MDR6609055.1 hypothetical protein [Pseudomonas synxantha]
MLKTERYTKIPMLLFVGICIAFIPALFVIEGLRGEYYVFCHALFGFSAPLCFGHFFKLDEIDWVPGRRLYKQVRNSLRFWRQTGSIRRGKVDIRATSRKLKPWTPIVGIGITVFFSMFNEIIVDPLTNKIPFLSSPEHFIADMLGLACFLMMFFLVMLTKNLFGQYRERLDIKSAC